jgi:tRNA (guanine-N7-)-methyltransferase
MFALAVCLLYNKGIERRLCFNLRFLEEIQPMTRLLKDYPSVSLTPENLDGRIDFVRIFGRSGPVHIEIGTGKATFLLNQARAQPDDNFLGIEWARKYYRYAVDRIGRWGLTNVRIIRTANLEQLLRCLKKDGQLRIATDHADYFEQIQKLIAVQDEELEEIEFFPTAGADRGEWVGTNFERKYIKDQRPIYTLAVRRT